MRSHISSGKPRSNNNQIMEQNERKKQIDILQITEKLLAWQVL